MHRLIVFFTSTFIAFILWVIYMADLGQPIKFHVLIMSIEYGDKIGHCFIYGMLALFTNLALKLRRVKLGALNVYVGGLFIFAFAAIEEVSQLYFPERTFDIVDLLAGAFGIVVFNALSRQIAKRLNLSFQPS
jgi:polysaccharide biosynthesis protein VpsQ